MSGTQGTAGTSSAATPTAKPRAFGPSAARLLRRLAGERLRLLSLVGLAVVSVVLYVLGPKVLGHATDIIFAGVVGRRLDAGQSLDQIVADARSDGDQGLADMLQRVQPVPGVGVDFTRLGQVLLLALCLFVGAGVLSWLQGYLLAGVVQRAVRQLRSEVEAKLNRLPLSYFDKQPRGELLSRATSDVENIAQSLQQTLSQLLTSLLTVIGVLVMMLVVSPLLAVIALVALPLSALVTRQIAKRSRRHFTAQWAHNGTLTGKIEEAFSGHELVRVFGRRREVQASLAATNDQLYEANFHAQFMSGIILPLMILIGNLSYVGIAVVGAIRVATGAISLGDVQAFIHYSQQFSQPLAQVASTATLVQSGVACAERVFDLLDAEEECPEPAMVGTTVRPAPSGAGRVVFDQVTFGYAAGVPLMKDLSLVVEPGQTVAIVGPTGAGKTTLVNLVMRFYELDGGRITLDGVDIAQLPRAQLRGMIGMVLQDAWLFGGTIRDNIAYGRLGATEDEILAAARATYVDRFVRGLPHGYETGIDEIGGNISAGEKQLVTIARAFLADPPLLILDEATTSVDSRTEVLVQRAMAALRTGRTTFVIAHRLSTIRDADLILVMEDGCVVEQGTEPELLAADGAYCRLYHALAGAASDEATARAGRGPVPAVSTSSGTVRAPHPR
ncbi:ABC transporter ATP-binding protein [Micromonospora sp. WMMD736]|uniref:ABC transporter ATP-binding protein n=1 Tax=Micromonospora sp. WMMD736 TaxID=3404112 RepID=UPI003B934A85